MGWFSVRARLLLWNMLILALVLGGFGAALCYSVQANQFAAINRDLVRRAGPPGPPGPHWGHGPFRDHGRPGEHRPGDWGPGDHNRGGPDAQPHDRGPGAPGFMPRGDGFPRFGPQNLEVGPPVPQPGPMSNSVGTRSDRAPGRPADLGPANGPRRDAFWMQNQRRGPDYGRPLMFDREGKPWGPWENDKPWDPASLRLSLQGQNRFSNVVVEGERLRVYSAPRMFDGRVDGVVQVAQPLSEMERLVDSQVHTLLILIPLALLATGLGGWLLTNHTLRPVRDVTQAAAQIGAEDLSRRLVVRGRDELAQLASTFNDMIARLEGAFQGLGQAYSRLERAYEEQRRFTGDASHELRTPLTRIKGSTSIALMGPPDVESYREALEVADEAADVMGRIVQDLLLLARSDAGQLPVRVRPFPIEAVLHRLADSFTGRAGPPLRFDLPPDQDLTVLGDEDHLTRLFVNLVENAMRHTPNEGSVTVGAQRSGNDLIVTVTDTGEGIAPEHLPHVCERFYRVDAVRTGGQGGTGLGLAICQSIVQAHGGSLSIESELGRGTTVRVTLPGGVRLPAAPEMTSLAA